MRDCISNLFIVIALLGQVSVCFSDDSDLLEFNCTWKEKAGEVYVNRRLGIVESQDGVYQLFDAHPAHEGDPDEYTPLFMNDDDEEGAAEEGVMSVQVKDSNEADSRKGYIDVLNEDGKLLFRYYKEANEIKVNGTSRLRACYRRQKDGSFQR